MGHIRRSRLIFVPIAAVVLTLLATQVSWAHLQVTLASPWTDPENNYGNCMKIAVAMGPEEVSYFDGYDNVWNGKYVSEVGSEEGYNPGFPVPPVHCNRKVVKGTGELANQIVILTYRSGSWRVCTGTTWNDNFVASWIWKTTVEPTGSPLHGPCGDAWYLVHGFQRMMFNGSWVPAPRGCNRGETAQAGVCMKGFVTGLHFWAVDQCHETPADPRCEIPWP